MMRIKSFLVIFILLFSQTIFAADDLILTYWGPSLDIPTDEQWSNYLETFKKLEEIGFTQVGIHGPYLSLNPDDPAGQQAWEKYVVRTSELRAAGFKLALHFSPGRILKDPKELDPQTHRSNGQNLKYFDGAGFVVTNCASWVGDCERSGLAVDPAYDGVVWQKELKLLETLIQRANIQSSDLVLFDNEIWGGNLGWEKWYYFYQNHPTLGAYPNLLNSSVSRYSGSREERNAQFIDYWQARNIDLKNVVKRYSPNSLVLFYGENIPDARENLPLNDRNCTVNNRAVRSCLCSAIDEKVICPIREITYAPIGTGDARSPTMYYLPDRQKFESDFAAGDFGGSYPWLSFSTSERNGSYQSTSWDSKITQKLGLRLREKGIDGIIIYPGPYDHNVSVDYFLLQAKALVDGFLRRLDPDAPPPLPPPPLPPPPPSDTAPPSAITDLKLTGLYPNGQIGLNWRAPYQDADNPASGSAVSYDLRYRLDTPITEANWSQAVAVTDEPSPRAPETVEIYFLSNLNPDAYYVAIRSRDAAGHLSPLSNNLLITVPEPPRPKQTSPPPILPSPPPSAISTTTAISPTIAAPSPPIPVIVATTTITANSRTAAPTVVADNSVQLAELKIRLVELLKILIGLLKQQLEQLTFD